MRNLVLGMLLAVLGLAATFAYAETFKPKHSRAYPAPIPSFWRKITRSYLGHNLHRMRAPTE